MKKQSVLFFLLLLISITGICQSIEPAPMDRAVVYFARPSSLGFAINFSYFDSTKLIGKFNGPKYIRYECEPGIHLFWARSENRDFVEAEVEAGKIYFIEAIVKMGALKAGVELLPVDPNDEKRMKKILKLIGKKPSESFTVSELEYDRDTGVISRGIEKYKKEKEEGKINSRLEKSMYFRD